MIELQSITVNESEVVTLANGVMLIGSKLNGSRPSAITIRTERGEIEIADFAQICYSLEAARLVPTCEVAIWNGKAFIVGLPSIVMAGEGVSVKCDLFRKTDEDNGFYRTEWVDAGQRIFCIYESGIVAWNDAGEVLWHVRKFWDDVFTGVEADGLVFLMHDGQRIMINQSDGSRRTPPNLPPS